MRSHLEQYRSGSTRSVWWELMEAGPLEEGAPLWEEVYQVARETMTRARHNVERIVSFLREQGYLFGCVYGSDDVLRPREPWLPPLPDTAARLAHLTSLVGPLPLSLRAWWEIVGSVSLQGVFPDEWEATHSIPMNDPLMIDPLDTVVREVEQELREDDFYSKLDLAPDVYHKANVSGGAPYQVRVPEPRADAPFLNVRVFLPTPPGEHLRYHEVELNETLVEHLRRSFRWAGFPGYAFVPDVPKTGLARLAPLLPTMQPL